MSTQQQRQEWRELAAAATPGEWGIELYAHKWGVWATDPVDGVDPTLICDLCNDGPDCQRDAAFIAAARAAVPQLLADVDALTQERDALAASWQQEHTERVRLEERLKAAEQRAEALQAQLHNQPSDYANQQAEERIRQIDLLFHTYGMNRDKWPQHAQDSFTRLDTAQREYEAKYC